MNPKAAVLSIGGEILDGRIHDTNAGRFIRALLSIDIPVVNILTCPDDIQQINDAFEFLFERCSVVLTCGGLGPTSDDLTREAVALFTEDQLVLDKKAEFSLAAYFERKQRPFDDTNKKQAYLPSRALPIQNNIGSAPGFIAAANGKHIVCLPGVPRELTPMLSETVIPYLQAEFPDKKSLSVEIIRFFGLPEATIAGIVERTKVSEAVSISYRATFPEIQLRLTGSDRQETAEAAQILVDAIGEEYLFSRSLEDSMAGVVHRLAVESNSILAVAESCTGGMLGSLLTRNSGSSNFFQGGVISYSNNLKSNLLGVSTETLARFGAVSHNVAREMAQGAKNAARQGVETGAKSPLGISITGIAGPEGGSNEKPVGTFYVGLSTNERTSSYRFYFNGEREAVRRFAAFAAMDVIRRNLLSLPVHAKEQEDES